MLRDLCLVVRGSMLNVLSPVAYRQAAAINGETSGMRARTEDVPFVRDGDKDYNVCQAAARLKSDIEAP